MRNLLSPHYTPVEREDLIGSIDRCIEQFCQSSENLDVVSGRIREEAKKILGLLPEMVVSRNVMVRRCLSPAEEVADSLDGNEQFQEEVVDLRKQICVEITFILYEDYIKEIIEWINENVGANFLNSKGMWSLGAFTEIDGKSNPAGKRLNAFWRNNVEPKGQDSVFREKILPHILPEYQEKYKCRCNWDELVSCEDWEGVARILEELPNKSRRSKAGKWAMGSLVNWKDKVGNMVGRSFRIYWFNFVEEKGQDLIFREKVLPHFSKELQDNYEDRDQCLCPYDWEKLVGCENWEAVAKILEELPNKSGGIRARKWGVGSLINWEDEPGNRIGSSFYHYWFRYVEEKGQDAFFKEKIFPHFSKKLQDNYELQGKCPHNWEELASCGNWQGIARILRELPNKKMDPAKSKWWWASMKNWTDEDRKPIGHSFWHWCNSLEKLDSSSFLKENVLSCLPQEWQNNYELSLPCPHNWEELILCENWKGIAKILQGLPKKLGVGRSYVWGLGSLVGWEDEEGAQVGRSFCYYWHTYIEPRGADTFFQEKILPHFSKKYRESYVRRKLRV
ncbi:hypothetical protein KJ632_03880 [Patescibacteria group bacterium]|nr:hypothetical protein [Patescibacteria group bacterium]